jgi:hypothetical protein
MTGAIFDSLRFDDSAAPAPATFFPFTIPKFLHHILSNVFIYLFLRHNRPFVTMGRN